MIVPQQQLQRHLGKLERDAAALLPSPAARPSSMVGSSSAQQLPGEQGGEQVLRAGKNGSVQAESQSLSDTISKECVHLRKRLELELQEYSHAEEELAAVMLVKEHFVQQLAKAQQERKSHAQEVEAAKAEGSSLQTQLSSLQKESQELQKIINERQSSVAKDSTKNSTKAMRMRCNAAMVELENLRKRQSKGRKEDGTISEKCDSMEREKSDLQIKCEDAAEKNRSLLQDISVLERERKRLLEALGDARRHHHGLHAKLIAAEQEKKTVKELVVATNNEHQQVVRKVATLTAEKKTLSKHHDWLQSSCKAIDRIVSAEKSKQAQKRSKVSAAAYAALEHVRSPSSPS